MKLNVIPLSSWSYVKEIHLLRFLENVIISNFDVPPSMTNLAAGLSSVGPKLIRRKIVKNVLYTDISETASQYVEKESKSLPQGTLTYMYYDLMNISVPFDQNCQVVLLTDFLSRLTDNLRLEVLVQLHKSIVWPDDSRLIVNGIGIKEINYLRSNELFELRRIYKWNPPPITILDKIKENARKILKYGLKANKELYNLEEDDIYLICHDNTATNLPNSFICLFYTMWNIMQLLELKIIKRFKFTSMEIAIQDENFLGKDLRDACQGNIFVELVPL